MANFRNPRVDSSLEYRWVHLRRRSLVLRKLANIAGGSIFEMGSWGNSGGFALFTRLQA